MNKLSGIISILSEDEMQSIHDGALYILEKVGARVNHQKALEYLADTGCRVDFLKQHVWFPTHIVEENVSKMRSSFELEASRGGREAMPFSYGNMYFATMPRVIHYPFTVNCGAFPPNVLDLEGNRRVATMQDVRDSIRLADALENIDFVGPPCSAQEIPHEIRPIVVAAELVKNTSKPGGIELWNTTQIEYISEIAAIVRGSKAELMERPLLVGYCGMRSPLCLDQNMAEIFIENIKRGFPQWLYTMPCGGLTAPATIMGTLTQGVAETLIGLVLGYAVDPEAIVSIDIAASLADMRSLGFPYSGPDVILLSAASNQMVTQFYKRPGGAHGGRTDACLTGVQAGIEKTLSMIFPLMVGATGIGTVGQIEKNMTFSYQQLVVDDEIVRYIKHIFAGVRGDPARRALDVIEFVGSNGQFINHPHTADHFREEFWISSLMERMRWEAWENEDLRSMEERSIDKAKRLIANHVPEPLSSEQVNEIDRIIGVVYREIER